LATTIPWRARDLEGLAWAAINRKRQRDMGLTAGCRPCSERCRQNGLDCIAGPRDRTVVASPHYLEVTEPQVAFRFGRNGIGIGSRR